MVDQLHDICSSSSAIRVIKSRIICGLNLGSEEGKTKSIRTFDNTTFGKWSLNAKKVDCKLILYWNVWVRTTDSSFHLFRQKGIYKHLHKVTSVTYRLATAMCSTVNCSARGDCTTFATQPVVTVIFTVYGDGVYACFLHSDAQRRLGLRSICLSRHRRQQAGTREYCLHARFSLHQVGWQTSDCAIGLIALSWDSCVSTT
jgi:hypothetical protein